MARLPLLHAKRLGAVHFETRIASVMRIPPRKRDGNYLYEGVRKKMLYQLAPKQFPRVGSDSCSVVPERWATFPNSMFLVCCSLADKFALSTCVFRNGGFWDHVYLWK